MPVGILTIQATVVSLLSLVFLLMPSVNGSYWILLALASILYMIMYILLFLSAIVLRIKKGNVVRPYRVPGGKWGIWIASALGFSGAGFGCAISFLPPSQLETGNYTLFISLLAGGLVLFLGAPFIIFKSRKPKWLE